MIKVCLSQIKYNRKVSYTINDMFNKVYFGRFSKEKEYYFCQKTWSSDIFNEMFGPIQKNKYYEYRALMKDLSV